MDKMVMIVYNEAIETEVMEVLEVCGLKNYTKVSPAFGRGSASGSHLGNEVWPCRNNILWVASPEDICQKLLCNIRALRERLRKEGIKAFVLPLEETT